MAKPHIAAGFDFLDYYSSYSDRRPSQPRYLPLPLPPQLGDHATMADSSTPTVDHRAPMTSEQLVEFVTKELDDEQEREAKAAALSASELPKDQQTGSTLDLSHKNISALPAEVVLLIKDRVERCAETREEDEACRLTGRLDWHFRTTATSSCQQRSRSATDCAI